MNFTDTCRALYEKRCEFIISENGTKFIFQEFTGVFYVMDDKSRERTISIGYVLGNWTLGNEKPVMETVAMSAYKCPSCMRLHETNKKDCVCGKYCSQFVELTGHFSRPVPEKVKRKCVYGGAIYSNRILRVNAPCEEIPIGKPLTLEISWDE
jgi:hypothetical protein